jgi:hypothetical protein
MLSEEKAMKVFDLLNNVGNLDREAVQFLEVNLAPFAEVLIQAGAHAMEQAGMERDEALQILETLAMVSRMAGATNFMDYVQINSMEGK